MTQSETQPSRFNLSARLTHTWKTLISSRSDFHELYVKNNQRSTSLEAGKVLNAHLQKNLGGWYSIARWLFYK